MGDAVRSVARVFLHLGKGLIVSLEEEYLQGDLWQARAKSRQDLRRRASGLPSRDSLLSETLVDLDDLVDKEIVDESVGALADAP